MILRPYLIYLHYMYVYVDLLVKWLFLPTAAGFLWCSPDAPSRSRLHHPIVSHSYTPTNKSDDGTGLFVLPAECAMLGTRDYSSMLVVPAAMAFIEVCFSNNTIIRVNYSLAFHCFNSLWVDWQLYVSATRCCVVKQLPCCVWRGEAPLLPKILRTPPTISRYHPHQKLLFLLTPPNSHTRAPCVLTRG